MIRFDSLRFVSEEEVLEIADSILRRPDSFAVFGDAEELFETEGFTFSQHRDSDALGRANWKVISADIMSADESAYVFSANHWAVGWIEHLVIRVLVDRDRGLDLANLTDSFWRVLLWRKALEDYPVASDETYSEIEREDLEETLTNCYSISSGDLGRVCSALYDRNISSAEELREETVREIEIELGIAETEDA